MANNVVMSFIARTSVFDKNVKNSGKNLKRFTTTTMSAKKAIVGFGSAIVAFVGVRALGGMLKRTADAIDVTAKFAARMNLSTESLLGFRLAAELAGEDVAIFDNGMQKLVRGIGQAAQGAGQARIAIEGMGISVRELILMSADKQFGAIADGINRLGTQAEKAAAAADIFGRAGINMLNTLALGSKGLEEITEKVKGLGAAYTAVEAAQVEAANDALVEMGKVLKGLQQRVVIELAAIIEAMADNMKEFALSAGNAADIASTGMEKLAKTISIVGDVARILHIIWEGLRLFIIKSTSDMIEGVNSLQKLFATVTNPFAEFFGSSVKINQEFDNLSEGFKDATNTIGKDFAKLITDDFPSTKIEKFLKKMKEDAKKNAIDTVEAGANPPTITKRDMFKDVRKDFKDQFARLKDQFNEGIPTANLEGFTSGFKKAIAKASEDLKQGFFDPFKEKEQFGDKILANLKKKFLSLNKKVSDSASKRAEEDGRVGSVVIGSGANARVAITGVSAQRLKPGEKKQIEAVNKVDASIQRLIQLMTKVPGSI